MKKLNKTSLQWQLFSRFFIILMVLLFSLGVFQYLTTKNYLSKSKIELLSAKFHEIDFKSLSCIDTTEELEKNASNIINKLVGININVSIISSDGSTFLTSKDSTNILIEKNRNITESHDENNDTSHEKTKKKFITSIPKLSSSDYINILNQYGNLEKTFQLVEDEDDNLNVVIWRKIGPLDCPTGLIQLSTPVGDIEEMLSKEISIYIGISIIVLIIGTIIGGAVFKQTLTPLSNMSRTLENITVTELNTRLPENNGQSEIDTLSTSFNNMLERIENTFEKEQLIKEKMRQFVSDASHELRTPLTSIHGFVEVLLRGAAKNEKQLNLALNSILLESERLTKLVNDLLTLNRLDQNNKIEFKNENINEVILEILPQLEILLSKRKIELELKDNVFANINKNQIKQIIFNLVQNSIRHTDENSGIITISTNIDYIENKKFIVLKISDNGTGISEKHLNKIFDRFFRSESHRAREQGGYGLGLSIVKSIIDAHNGQIKVESKLGIGTTFSIYLN
ncbi:HAMP domain-containing histidine kinase [Clostridium sp. SHJSY1]|uniref:sensor histidine kinase n=1 Tax=Clostridium sp. SHJSY1 TaxID=2942483 RepID=UPI002874CA74|nr:HAMP domain-containing sensor histidine kinase [Clostridium sp. SHJSY1]MDS0526467.1 HAMP domain-containing histidine kinase [Clostridium sp. SHJSY1]